MSDSVSKIKQDLKREVHKYVLVDEQEAMRRAEPSGVALLRRSQHVNSHLPIGWPVMPAGIWPKLVCYAQKITRRLLRWYINPIVDQQNEFNKASADLLAAQYRLLSANEEKLAYLEQELELSRQELENLRQEVRAQRDLVLDK